MKAVLEIVKTHWISLLSGAVIIACVALAFSLAGSEKVEQEMQATLQRVNASSISNLSRDPKNEEIIAAEEAKVAQFKREYEQALEVARGINGKEPLMPGIFPRPANAQAPYEFIDEYGRTVRRFPGRLLAGTLPTDADRAEEQQNIEDLLQLIQEKAEEEEGLGGGRTPPADTFAPPVDPGGGRFGGGGGRFGDPGGGRFAPPAGGGRFAGPAGGGRFGGGGPPTMGGGGGNYQLSQEQRDDPRFNEQYRAIVSKAKSIRIYIDDEEVRDPIRTFDVAPLYGSNVPPSPLEMWKAQVSLWIQDDVVTAIAELNEQAAQAAGEEEAYVEHMPVKRLQALRVRGYLGAPEALRFESIASPSMAGQTPADASLTGLTSNEEYDVLRFSVTAVVDQRQIIALIDAISRQNFYQCIDVSYVAVDREADAQLGYMYGTAPIVQVTLDFEGYMLRSLYKPLMPDSVKEALGIPLDTAASGG